MTKTKKKTIHGKTCSKYQLKVNELRRQINECHEALRSRLELVKKYDKFTKKLLKEKRITKEEMKEFITKKNSGMI